MNRVCCTRKNYALRNQYEQQIIHICAGRAGNDQIAERLKEVIGIVVGQICTGASNPIDRARLIVSPVAIAPAASVGPSVPSVPSAAMSVLGNPSIAIAAASAIS